MPPLRREIVKLKAKIKTLEAKLREKEGKR
jgi:hypothetical protein